MSIALFLLYSVSSLRKSSAQCRGYQCYDKLLFQQGQCAQFNTTTSQVQFKECASDNSYCPYQDQSLQVEYYCQQKPNIPAASRFAGEYCQNQYDCVSGLSCIKNKCFNQALQCSHTWQCNPGQYCLIPAQNITGTCTQQLTVGKTCTGDDQCPGNALCIFQNSTDTQTKCVSVLSIQNGQSYAPSSYYSEQPTFVEPLYITYACQSLIAYKDSSTMTCVQRPQLTNTGDCAFSENRCKVDIQIKDVVTSNTDCVCSHSGNNESYCQPAPGDSAYSSYLDALSQFAKSSAALNCNNAAKFSSQCMQTQSTSDYNQLVAKQSYALNYATLKYSSTCYAKTMFPTYWQEEGQYVNDFANWIAAGLLFIVFQ